MVGRFVEQQQVGLAQQQLGERHAALFTAREIVDRGIARRAAQRVHRLLDLGFEVPQVLRVDHVLQLAGLLGILVVVVGHQRVVLVEDRLLGGHAFHDIAHDIERGIELRLLLRDSRRWHRRPARPRRSTPCRCPAMMRSSVDLPEPLGPSTPILASG